MADSKISALTSGNPAQSGDEIPIARGGANYKITAGSIASLSGNGDVVGPASSTDSQIALFNSTTGKLIKAATTTGVLKASSGVIAAATSGTDYVAPAGAFSGLSWQSVQTTGFTAVAFRAYPCNTTSAAFTVTLPASPSAGDQITLTDYAGTWGTNNLTINPNGGKINGNTANAILTTNRGSVQLVYVDSTQGWVAYSGWAATELSQTTPTIDYAIVAGGGGGGSGLGGGGGAGGFRTGTNAAVSGGTTYTITVGNSGTAGTGFDTASAVGGNGGNSSIVGGSSPSPFASPGVVSAGGGGGGAYNQSKGKDGGSGGGGSCLVAGILGGGTGNTPASSSPPDSNAAQGKAGGSGASADIGGGGGGGANASTGAGSNGSASTGGNGGAGATVSAALGGGTYAGGGGGGGSPFGSGGSGGGGAGAYNPTGAVNGSTNTGGGGGGTKNQGDSGSAVAGAGGSGIVIIAYPDTYRAATTTGSPTVVVSGGYRRYTFTGNGTITF